MKRLFAFALFVFLVSCTPTTRLTATWMKGNSVNKNYNSFLVMSLNAEISVQAVVENDVSAELTKAGVVNYQSNNEFPPRFAKDSITRHELNSKIKEKNIDAILTVSAIKKESDSRYISGNCEYNPNIYYFNGRFWGYYHYWYPCVYQQGYYIDSEKYFIETNLYDAATEELIWSAQSVTYNPLELKKFSMSYAKVIVSRLKADLVIK